MFLLSFFPCLPCIPWLPSSSDQVQAAFRDAGAVALGAGAADDERVPVHVEVVNPADVADDALDCRVLELDHLAAQLALQVLMLRITVVVLILLLRACLQTAPKVDGSRAAPDSRPECWR